jgi:hypothetical protein
LQAPQLLLLQQLQSWRHEDAANGLLLLGCRRLLALLVCMPASLVTEMVALLLNADAACAPLQRQPQRGTA